ncbi:unnamed protein product [Gongylonema pulchrum]|uniref:YrzI family protein n=1 Tax=Gongylonema pulchrum TaxID=637853 RepID=A0A183D6C0_9BILA|nr:unnamed protein product [Gongylonema pulchrum]
MFCSVLFTVTQQKQINERKFDVLQDEDQKSKVNTNLEDIVESKQV